MKTTEIGDLIKAAMRREASSQNYDGVEALDDLTLDIRLTDLMEFDEYMSINRLYETLQLARYGPGGGPDVPDAMDKVHADIEEDARE